MIAVREESAGCEKRGFIDWLSHTVDKAKNAVDKLLSPIRNNPKINVLVGKLLEPIKSTKPHPETLKEETKPEPEPGKPQEEPKTEHEPEKPQEEPLKNLEPEIPEEKVEIYSEPDGSQMEIIDLPNEKEFESLLETLFKELSSDKERQSKEDSPEHPLTELISEKISPETKLPQKETPEEKCPAVESPKEEPPKEKISKEEPVKEESPKEESPKEEPSKEEQPQEESPVQEPAKIHSHEESLSADVKTISMKRDHRGLRELLEEWTKDFEQTEDDRLREKLIRKLKAKLQDFFHPIEHKGYKRTRVWTQANGDEFEAELRTVVKGTVSFREPTAKVSIRNLKI